MNRFAVAACAVACLALPILDSTTDAARIQRALPMQFEFWTEGPAQACGSKCRTWVSATGAITADTPRDFEAFARNHKLRGATIALDSDGGSVLGALELGRAIRRLGMITTVGKTIDLAPNDRTQRRARLSPHAYCESMCAFVLLAGIERHVPAEARVLVHQIWLGDRRDDPTAASYSAEDLVLVQRDIGRLARYTVEMGGSIGLLEIALRIPPWEPMRALTREELRGMKILTAGEATEASAGPAAMPALASGARSAGNGRTWTMVADGGRPVISRSHPLTVEGEEIGTFELAFACGDAGDVAVTYLERRNAPDGVRAPRPLTEVEISLAGRAVPLTLSASRTSGRALELESVANGRLPAELFKTFADSRGRSLTVETVSEDLSTTIRVGNAGMERSLPQFLAACAGQPRSRSTAHVDLNPGG
jgi:hypothetical protein